jgi:uncharacterized protein with von Willebrand factor type A (vWA) domain
MPVISLTDLLGLHGGKIGTKRLKLASSVVSHDSLDEMEFGNFADDSPRFRRVAIEEAPVIAPDVPDPEPIDFTTATRDEVGAWQLKAREAKAARDKATPYVNWEKLTRDVFYSYHTHDTPTVVEQGVDPGVELHKRIIPKLITTDDHAQSRNATRDDATMSAMAAMAATRVLREVLGDELVEQAREAQEFAEACKAAEDAVGNLDDLREQARQLHKQGRQIPLAMRDSMKQQIDAKRAAQAAAQRAAANQTPMNGAALQAIAQAAEAAQGAAEAASGLPSFGAGFGGGEPSYENPEQALSIAEMWANNPELRKMAELFGRMDKDIRFQRSTRVIGGNDEIVDVEFGDNLSRVLPAELALFADDDTELDFLARYASRELLCFSTVGEENAGRGPIIIVLDGSGSMGGERNIWARAISMCLLHIARLEKRDFACVEFSSGGQVEQWLMPAKVTLQAQGVLDMASHFFGGGTSPIIGVAAAAKLMQDAPVFKKADIVLVGDGEAGFGPEDARLRDQMIELGVRLFGIGIGGGYQYLANYCEHVVSVHDFELTDPSQATAELATHIT